MADYSFIVPSYFKPLSFQERLAPFLIAKQEYDKQEQEYLDRQDKIDRYSYLNGYDDDSPAKKLYQGYVNEYNRSFDDFQQNGMSQANKRSWLDVRRTYQKNIGRLDEAQKKREQEILEQRQLYLKDPTMMFSKEASLSTLDDYLNDRKKPYQAYSGALLAQQASNAGAAIAKGLVEVSQGKKFDQYTKTWKEQYGLDANQVAFAVSNPRSPEANQLLRRILDNVVDSSRIPEWADETTLNQAYKYAAQGLWSTVGQTQVHTYDDYGAKLAAQLAKDKELEAYKQSLVNQQNKQLGLGEPDSELWSIFNNADNATVDKYFMKNNQGRLVMKNGIGLASNFSGVSPFIYDPKDKKYRFKTQAEMDASLEKKHVKDTEPNLKRYPGESALDYSVRVRGEKGVSVSASKNYGEFLDLMKNAGINTATYRFTSKVDKHGSPLMEAGNTSINDNINRTYLDNTPVGYNDIGLTRMRVNDAGSTATINFLKGHREHVREIKDISSIKGVRTYNTLNSISKSLLDKKDTRASELLYDTGTNTIITTINDKKYTVPASILPVDEQRQIQRYADMLNHPAAYNNGKQWTSADVAGLQSLISNSLMRALQVYGTHNSTETDYNYE